MKLQLVEVVGLRLGQWVMGADQRRKLLRPQRFEIYLLGIELLAEDHPHVDVLLPHLFDDLLAGQHAQLELHRGYYLELLL